MKLVMKPSATKKTKSGAFSACELHWGELSVAQFLVQFWQQKPLLLRAFVSPSSVDSSLDHLLKHAERDDVEARLIRQRRSNWSMKTGPFDRLPSLRSKHWTVLLQGMDRIHDQAYRLRMAFDFLPHVRIDDVMISVASEGGGVGPHLDEYDVFLVQGCGSRRWRWGYQKEQSFQPDKPLKLLQQFTPQFEAVLEPGDVLYLPPRWAHDGIALEPCSTWSVGFRAPSRHEFLQHFLIEAAESLEGPNPRYQDFGLRASKQAGRIPARLASTFAQWAADFRSNRRVVEKALGRFLSEPAPNAWFEGPRKRLARHHWLERSLSVGIALHPASRMVYDTRKIWLNGEPFGAPNALLRKLADQRYLNGKQLEALLTPKLAATLSNAPTTGSKAVTNLQDASECKKTVEFQQLIGQLFAWYQQGWIAFFDESPSQRI
jgi:50S ribosomal protein L16 3-hydroxylase